MSATARPSGHSGISTWFRRDSAGHDDPTQPEGAARTTTWIAKGVTVTGSVTGGGRIQVDGRIEGRVELAGELVVLAEGEIDGPIEATSVRIAGMVRGAVIGRERVEVASTGRVEGDITSKRVAIAEGAVLAGEVAMLVEPPARPAKP